MKEILRRIESTPDFRVEIFSDYTILEEPVENWPLCDCLISFFSVGFPLKKVMRKRESH